MGKVLKPLAIIAGIGLQFIPGVGNAVGALLLGSGAAAMGGALIGTIAVGALGAGLAVYGSSPNRPRGSNAPSLQPFDPKSINADPTAPRKIVFGRTAFPLDLRYAEPSGENQEFIDYIFVCAAHGVDFFEEIWIEDDLAWTAARGEQGKYVGGYFSVEVIKEASASLYHTVNGGTTWGSSTRLTGCATMRVRVKRSDNNENSQSPFASGINGRWSVIGRGMPVYDPARDDSQPGGSGLQRANDNSTWQYTAGSVTRGNNPALQLLSYLLGWRIGGRVSVGCGLPADTIDIASFAAAAALCDESVALSGGGTQRRFEAGRAFSDADDPIAVIKTLCDAMNAELVDDGGRLALRIAVNDLTPVMTLTDDDFVSGYSWRPAPPVERQYTVVRGRFSQPAAPTLYSMADYPEVDVPRTSLAPRPITLELTAVQDQRRAQRIAKQTAQRSLYQGEFEVALGLRGWMLRRNHVVAITSSVRGWTSKLFRVRSATFSNDGTVNVLLREENAAIYAWDREESALVTPAAPVVFDSRAASSWLMAGIDAGATRNVARGSYDNATLYALGDEVIFSGSTYRLKVTSSTGNPPPDTSRWDLVAAIGQSGITISLTNESHVVPTAADGTGGNFTTAGGIMRLLRGSSTLAPTFSVAASSPSPASWISIDASTGVYTVTDPGVDLATATLRAAFEGVNYDRTYTVAKSKQGNAAQGVVLSASSQSFTFNGTGDAVPSSQSISFAASVQNVAGTVTWQATAYAANGTLLGSVPLSGSGNSRTMSLAQFNTYAGTQFVQVQASLGGFVDATTIYRLVDGTPAVSGFFNREAAVLPARADGVVDSYALATATFSAFLGLANVSSQFSLSVISNPQALTVGVSGQTITVTDGFDGNEDTATITVRATGSGTVAGVTIDRTFSLSKARNGVPVVSTLPTTGLFVGQQVFLTTDGKTYRNTTGLFAGWTASTAATDLTGQITTPQVTDNAITNLSGANGTTSVTLTSSTDYTVIQQVTFTVTTGATFLIHANFTIRCASNANSSAEYGAEFALAITSPTPTTFITISQSGTQMANGSALSQFNQTVNITTNRFFSPGTYTVAVVGRRSGDAQAANTSGSSDRYISVTELKK